MIINTFVSSFIIFFVAGIFVSIFLRSMEKEEKERKRRVDQFLDLHMSMNDVFQNAMTAERPEVVLRHLEKYRLLYADMQQLTTLKPDNVYTQDIKDIEDYYEELITEKKVNDLDRRMDDVYSRAICSRRPSDIVRYLDKYRRMYADMQQLTALDPDNFYADTIREIEEYYGELISEK